MKPIVKYRPVLESQIPKRGYEASTILEVNSKIKVSAEWWTPENRSAAIQQIADLQSKAGELISINVEPAKSGLTNPREKNCQVCGWIHDAGFNQITTEAGEEIYLRGVLSKIVQLVHQAHERGLESLCTKDEALLDVCRGYHNPCKAFDDLKRREEYKRLFDTSRRGFITLRGAAGRNRNKSVTRPE
jgi:hypothetical protein